LSNSKIGLKNQTSPAENSSKPRVLLLSGYDATSHRYWRDLLQESIEQYNWTQIALADRFFSWRVRGNSLTFAFEHRETLQQDFDLLIVTSMVDLSSLRGFVPNLAFVPTLVYVHENQFDYPENINGENLSNRLNAQITSIYSLLCADKILFNSEYNRNTFFAGAEQLLKRLPDGVPKLLLDKCRKISTVLAVPIARPQKTQQPRSPVIDNERAIEILWNHRWEYDKQPDVFFEALSLLKKQGYVFRLHVVGQSFRKSPECFQHAKREFSQEIHSWGFQPRGDYFKILSRSDIVVSTAIHDFQGLSMLEAIAYGCFPVAPDRVAYPEYIYPLSLYSTSRVTVEKHSKKRTKLTNSNGSEATTLYNQLASLFEQYAAACSQQSPAVLDECEQSAIFGRVRDVSDYFDDILIDKYREIFDHMIE
jgi:glycosyltransferase involved in cell wall biosynthesis